MKGENFHEFYGMLSGMPGLDLIMEEGMLIVQNDDEVLGVRCFGDKVDISYMCIDVDIVRSTLDKCSTVEEWVRKLDNLSSINGYQEIPYFKSRFPTGKGLEVCAHLGFMMACKSGGDFYNSVNGM